MKKELARIGKKGKSLWCNGLKKMVEDDVTICVDDSDFSDEEQQPVKKPKLNALESKVQRVDALANELKEKHQDKYNKIQYKLWAEALGVKRHSSKEDPPAGPIWNSQKSKSQCKTSVDAMATAFTEMANSVASVFTRENTTLSPSKTKPALSTPEPSHATGISPSRRIDLQERLLKQIDLLHKMFERGAVTVEQFEKRRDSLLSQLDGLANDNIM